MSSVVTISGPNCRFSAGGLPHPTIRGQELESSEIPRREGMSDYRSEGAQTPQSPFSHRGGVTHTICFPFSSNLQRCTCYASGTISQHKVPQDKPTFTSSSQEKVTPHEEAEFNEWQYWRVPVDTLPPLENQGQRKGQDPPLVPTVKLLLTPEQPATIPCVTYLLTPCSECFGTRVEVKQDNRGQVPLSFWASGLNFCGHPRQLLRMGNQAGKDKDKDPPLTKSKKTEGSLIRLGSKPKLNTDPVVEDSSVGRSTIERRTIGASTKNRAPPPPLFPSSPACESSSLPRENTVESASGGLVILEGRNLDDSDNEDVRSRNGSLDPNYNHSYRSDDLSVSTNFEEDNSFDEEEVSTWTPPDTFQTALGGGGSVTGSFYSAIANISPLEDDGDDDTLRNQSDQISMDSVEIMLMPTSEVNGSKLSLCLDESISQMTSSADLNFNASAVQRPMTTSFTLTRKRKVELSSVSSPVDDVQSESAALAFKDTNGNTTGSDDCFKIGGDDYVASGPPHPRRYNSVTDVPTPDSNVLRKVASLTFAELQTQQGAQAKALTKPKFVPEKLDFRLYEKFEGQMLINWFVSCLEDGNYVKDILSVADQKFVANQFCTLLLAAGVLKQIEDVDGDAADKIFRILLYVGHLALRLLKEK